MRGKETLKDGERGYEINGGNDREILRGIEIRDTVRERLGKRGETERWEGGVKRVRKKGKKEAERGRQSEMQMI